jgi:hypothetical protein
VRVGTPKVQGPLLGAAEPSREGIAAPVAPEGRAAARQELGALALPPRPLLEHRPSGDAPMGLAARPAGAFAAHSPELRTANVACAQDANLDALARAREYLARQPLDDARREEVSSVLESAAGSPRLVGFADWVRFSTGQAAAADPIGQARNLLDDVGELRVALTMARTLPEGSRVRVGADALAKLEPVRGDRLPSFDLVVEGPAQRNIDVYSAWTSNPSRSELIRAINHAADKVLGAPLPEALWTVGSAEAAVRLRWPPETRTTRGGRVTTDADGNVTLLTGNGLVIDRGNIFEEYLWTLRDPRQAPVGASAVDRLDVYSYEGEHLFFYRRDRETGEWTGGRPER